MGVGTGLAANCLLQEIAQRQGAGKLRGLKVVPASDVAASEAAFHGVPLTTLQASRAAARWSGRILAVLVACNTLHWQPRPPTPPRLTFPHPRCICTAPTPAAWPAPALLL